MKTNTNTRPTLFTIRDNLGRMNAILLFQKLRFYFNHAAPEKASEDERKIPDTVRLGKFQALRKIN